MPNRLLPLPQIAARQREARARPGHGLDSIDEGNNVFLSPDGRLTFRSPIYGIAADFSHLVGAARYTAARSYASRS